MTERSLTVVRGQRPRPIPVSAAAVRVLGGICLAAALLLPFVATLRRARLMSAPPEETIHLRPELLVLPANLGQSPPRRPFAITTTHITLEHWSAVLDREQPDPEDRQQSVLAHGLTEYQLHAPAMSGAAPDPTTSPSLQLSAIHDYCNRLSTLEGWPTCYPGPSPRSSCLGYRLPTREELDYAARADLPVAADDSPNRWGLHHLNQRARLVIDADALTPADPIGFVVVRTCPDPPRSCASPHSATPAK